MRWGLVKRATLVTRLQSTGCVEEDRVYLKIFLFPGLSTKCSLLNCSFIFSPHIFSLIQTYLKDLMTWKETPFFYMK